MIIAIDGPAGSGKSSTARAVASKLGITFLDTGAMYRAITLKALRENIAHDDDEKLADLVKNTKLRFSETGSKTLVLMDDEDVTEPIRGEAVTSHVSDYCARDVVRESLVEQQRQISSGRSVVAEGRDIGTAVFPDAQIKIFMCASVKERALRRKRDFDKLGIEKSVDELIKEIEIRDLKDSTRKNSPLCKAEDAIELDTTGMTLEEQIDFIVKKASAFLGTETRNS
ncbi:(d)CMP kinase [Chitinispirillales bacterium ANBcel5]|uniref:(d)CMP kinase n=1 Tax=Cellulosispirillum alkaliphilum TaxID=3039283 RepID=UPI002A592FF4|nr:(d)CMP kinase [Chitinispirillales bacterium ANBcel5]